LDGTQNLNTTSPASPSPSVKLAALSALLLLLAIAAGFAPAPAPAFHFALLGDRTGEAQPGVYAEAWREAAAEHPAFVLTVGDTIQGGNDQMIASEWKRVMRTIAPYRLIPLFLTPGNHDVWDAESAAAFEIYARHPLHYSFDWQQAHFTVLDDSQSDNLPASELDFLQKDLAAHQAQPVKFIVSHRPTWLFHVLLGNPSFPLHQLARQYGVKYVIAGHIHQMLRFELDGITYLSIASSGGHLRNDKAYRHGWFFQHTDVTVEGRSASFKIEELRAPFGKGRISTPSDWGTAGLSSQIAN
jgi:predicted phosphodiesterase